MALHVLICVVFITGLSGRAIAAPYVPASDGQVLERLPFTASDPVMRELRTLHSELNREPDNLPLGLRLAQGYLELGRATGDPRYSGYAEAALAPWWHLEQAPQGVLVVRATLRQRMHQFDAALEDLAIVLNANPRNAQAAHASDGAAGTGLLRGCEGRMPRSPKSDPKAGVGGLPDQCERGDG
jgi:hypothetical protein